MTLTAIILVAVTLSGIAATDATPQEARTLMKIARIESGNWRVDVADCRVLGRIGERGIYQVIARTAEERAALCRPDTAAPVALDRVRESVRACKHLPPPDRLRAYVSGSCSRGGLESRRRWSE